MVSYSLTANTYHGKTADLLHYFHERIPNFCIDEKMRKALCFRERLEIFYKNNYTTKLEPIGTYFTSVESVGPKSQEFFVQIILSMKINGQPIASRVTCSATKELHCIEEKKYEYLGTSTNSCERRVYVGHGDDGYFLKMMGNSIDDEQSQSICISYNDITFLSDGCSILLMRYLAMTDFCGTLCFDVITIEGKIIECTYECSSLDMKIKNMKVSKIVQRFYVDDAISSTIETILTKQGSILSINLADSPYVMKINSHVDLHVKHGKPITLPLREEWKQDFELISKHSDKKVYEKDRKEKYLQLHLEMNEILSDYIQRLLHRKPDDVIQFTIDHFNTFISETKDFNARN